MSIPIVSASRPRIAARLLEIALESPRAKEMEAFYRDAMSYDFAGEGSESGGRGCDRAIRIVPGEISRLAYAVYSVQDLQGLRELQERLSAAEVPFQPTSKEPGRFLAAITFQDPDANTYVFGVEDPVARKTLEERCQERPARLQHLVTASTDPGSVVAFFRDIIGFVVSDTVLDDEGGVRTAFLRSSEEHHSFAVFKAPENRLDHHCYETRDWNAIRDWADHFAQLDIPLFWGPGRHGPGDNLFIFAHDPDGNSVELSAELEIIPTERPIKEWAHVKKTMNHWGQALMRS